MCIVIRALLIITTIFLPLLGVTWIFGILAVNEEPTAFAWIFAILNVILVITKIINWFQILLTFLFYRAHLYLCFMLQVMIRYVS